MAAAILLLVSYRPLPAQQVGDDQPPPAAPDTVGVSTPAGDAPLGQDVVGDTLPLNDEVPAPPPAAAETTAGDSVESLEKVRADLEAARERLAEVQETLETIPAEDRPRRSPKGAVIRAFALPGWGQLYTGHPVRAAMYAAGEVGFATLGFLKQAEVNEVKEDQTAARLAFVAELQATNPDTVFTFEDSLALFEQFDRTEDGAQLAFELETAQEQREDYFTYAIFSVLFAAIDAFVSAHLEPYEDLPRAELRRGAARGWEVGVRVPLGVGTRPGGGGPAP